MTAGERLLALGGALSLTAALAHLAVIAGGPDWYRFFGAGEGMARLAARGDPKPALITVAIATILAAWATFAFSGAGLIPRLPLLRTALIAISAVYLIRGALVVVPAARFDQTATFWLWSSAIVLALGAVHAAGTWLAWDRLSGR